MLRNPLASPDIIGISYGASAAAVIAIVMLGWRGRSISWAALVGALLVAGLIYLLSWHRGVAGYRLILVGIGIDAIEVARIRRAAGLPGTYKAWLSDTVVRMSPSTPRTRRSGVTTASWSSPMRHVPTGW